MVIVENRGIINLLSIIHPSLVLLSRIVIIANARM